MNTLPKITVVTVTYNAEKCLEETIQSIINQTYPNIEYIVIDGGSKDGTIDIIKKYAAHIDYWVSEPDKGVYDAMNKGIDKATGKWINFMNAGDYYYSNTVLLNLFNKNIPEDVMVYYGDTIKRYDFGDILLSKNKKRNNDPIMPFCHQSVFVKIEILQKYKFDIQYQILADRDLFYRIKKDGNIYKNSSIIVSVFDAQYGLSSIHRMKAALECLKIYHKEQKFYYLCCKFLIYVRFKFAHIVKYILPMTVILHIRKFKNRKKLYQSNCSNSF